jgi:hypothetical protein
MDSTEAKQPCYTGGSKPSDVSAWRGDPMLHLWPNGPDNSNARAELWHPVLRVLIEVGISLGVLLVFVVYWVAAALLLHSLAP